MINGKNPWTEHEYDRIKALHGVWHDWPGVHGWRFKLAPRYDWNFLFWQEGISLAFHPKYSDAYRRCIEGGETPTPGDAELLQEMDVKRFVRGCVMDCEFEDREGSRITGRDVDQLDEVFLAMPQLFKWAKDQAWNAENFRPDKGAIEKNSETVSTSKLEDGAESNELL